MKNLTSKILATTLISVVSLTAVSTAALANGPQRGTNARGPGGFPLLALNCGENGGERLNNVLGRVAQRIDMTDEQTAAFNDFKTAALAAQSSVSEVCVANKPDPTAERDLIDRLNTGQVVMAARVTAMGNVIPVFEVFFDTLSDEQKAKLRPRGPGPRGAQQGQHGNGPKGNVHITINNGADNS